LPGAEIAYLRPAEGAVNLTTAQAHVALRDASKGQNVIAAELDA